METPQQVPEDGASPEPELEALVVASGSRPTTSDEAAAVLERFLRETVPPIFALDPTMDVRGFDAARVTAHPLAGDLMGLDLDFTGLEVTLDPTVVDTPPTPDFPAFGTEVSRADAKVAEVRARALPIRIQDVDVDATVTATGVHVDWAEDDLGQLALALKRGTAGGEAVTVFPVDALSIDLSAQQQAVSDAVVKLVQESAASQGFRVPRLEFELTQAGPRGVHVHVSGKVKRGLLGASLLFTTEAQLGDDLKMRLLKPALTSHNPIIGLLLLAVRKQIREELKDPIDLRDLQLDPLKLDDVQFEVGERLRLRLDYS
ncbi:hypothetical protein HDC34_000505 [Pseudoclavibacter sp. JAI123]|uniref:hypothetical protein n=1 Tax=Pseudoclavibacter sp. JAI123 TaxID=2723065 RepID=UPI0015CD64BE|nr:hypothetical protein [Pseudoclavibacter sp. JAI123]NYF12211.1 hypothetical protein [Pseudoclavibacter sp. JAI123]